MEPRGKRTEVARRTGYSPSHITKVLKPGADGAGPEFCARIQEHYPEWRPAWHEYLAIRSGDVEAAETQRECAERIARIEEIEKELVERIREVCRLARQHYE